MPQTRPMPVRFPMDPRIRRRRIEVQRRAGRRRLRVLVGVAVLVLLTVGGWLAVRSPLLDVDRIEVQGAAHTPRAAVLGAARLHRGAAMVNVDQAAAGRRIESLPWVGQARVRRAWPGTVLITVTEREPKAVTSTDGQHWALLDGDGRVLELTAARPPGLVALEGVGAPGAAGTTLETAAGALRVAQVLTPALASRTAAVVAMQGGEIALRLDPHGTVRLGPPDDIAAKEGAAESVLAQVDAHDLDVLDVRLPSSPALTRG